MKSLVFALCLLAVAAAACGKKSAPDTSKYEAICTRVAECDAQVKVQPNGRELCLKGMVVLEQKWPAKVPEMEACLKETACEQMSLGTCMGKVGQGMSN